MADKDKNKDLSYPRHLKEVEEGLLCKRRGVSKADELKNKVGFGLSGGGIRSATFCLGLFQGLVAKTLPPEAEPIKHGGRTLLSKIDYLSTVSGGGYFGAFYGRLFTRDDIQNFSDIEEILSARAASEEERRTISKPSKQQTEQQKQDPFPKGNVFRWLRENGRYLAPNGSGDVLLGGAAIARNLIAVHLVLATFLIMFLLGAQLVRGIVEVLAGPAPDYSVTPGSFAHWWQYEGALVQYLPWGKDAIWWSPYAIFVALVLLFWVVPPAWSYWLVEKPNRSTAGRWIPPIWGLIAVGVLSLGGTIVGAMRAWMGSGQGVAPLWVCLLVLVVSIETMLWALYNDWRPALAAASEGSNSEVISKDETLRFLLSDQLKTALVVFGAAFAFVAIDSLAQTAYAEWCLGELHVKLWATAILGPLITIIAFARKVLSGLGEKTNGKRFAIPLTLAAGVAAIVISVLILVALDFGSYAIAWKLALPLGPRPKWTFQEPLREANQLTVTPTCCGWTIAAQTPESKSAEPGTRQHFSDLLVPGIAFGLSALFSFLFGWSWPFLNRSTHHPIYTSRLIRAYLGASNPKRLGPLGRTVTETIAGDDIAQHEYWPRFLGLRDGKAKETIEEREKQYFATKGMPIHLVNVTINETLDARSQIEQHDRKGIGMAIGPAGLSAGVVHHLVLSEPSEKSGAAENAASPDAATSDVEKKANSTLFEVHPDGDAPDNEIFRVFRYPGGFEGEFLSLGNWTGISGAAFSTSLGWRTSLGFSLLAGLANVRLTYWWNSGVEPLDLVRRRLQQKIVESKAAKLVEPFVPSFYKLLVSGTRPATAPASSPARRRWVSSLFQLLFSVQTFLFDELLARFHGTALQWWPLSDGGHFENMGGYELIRRRLPMIVVVDAEADPDYTFEGLANLVRKARLDFRAEITFLDEGELTKRVHPGVRDYFGTLEQLRRGTWVEEPIVDPNVPKPDDGSPRRKRLSINPVDEQLLSVAHAALADVTYYAPDGSASGDKSLLLYIKPTLTGDEPADVRRYHTEHPSFPHETTLQQFFDEAQWESYRRLGEDIADKIFRNDLKPQTGKFLPYTLEP